MELEQLTAQFIAQLRPRLAGEIDVSAAARQVYATDNSIYQQSPTAIIYPRHQQDLQVIMQLISQQQYRELSVTPRGGGTGTNGQSLTQGIVVDVSRHMNQILHIDPIARTAVVQAGVVKDQLNAALKPYGLFFAPELSTSNRATIGGMINTDASGQGSCRYGKTHHHVQALSTVLLGGELLESQAIALEDWDQYLQTQSEAVQQIYRQARDLAEQQQSLIQNSFPALNRALTGYDLPHVLQEGVFNLNALLCGSEGTLGMISQATLNVLPIPKYRMLVNIGYANFQDALKDAVVLMQHQPLSIETVDSKVLNLAKQDVVWHKVATYFPEQDLNAPIEGINLVEFDGETEQQLQRIKADFFDALDQDHSMQRLTRTVAWGGSAISDVYAMRKRAVGLLGNVQGEKRPQPFVEDTAVPPENLAAYILDFRALLDSYGLDYGMFGHVDAGVLHVRPALDMKDPNALQMVEHVTDAVVKLTHQYGGVLWGEHGKGLRSAYAPIFFGEAYPLLQKVKRWFDPYNQLNPGKIATPEQAPQHRLIAVTEVTLRGDFDRQIASKDWQAFGSTMHCNGNGACFNYDLDDPMCPSYKVTRNRIHSPKGRASLLKEWLRREAQQQQQDHFDQEVYDALHGCLSCKSCVGQCPVKVNIPESKALFLQRYHQRHRRSLRDYALANLERMLPQLAKLAPWYNLTQKILPIKALQGKALQLVDLPLFHPQAQVNLQHYGAQLLTHDIDPQQIQDNAVFIVQDGFTRYFDTPVMLAALRLIQLLGFQAYIVPYFANGKPLHVHGFLDQFEALRHQNIQLLNRIAALGYPLVGIDPAMTLVYRQEYHHDYQKQRPPITYQVLLLQEWLDKQLATKAALPMDASHTTYYLAGHCTERTQLPQSNQLWQKVYQHFGLRLEPLQTGCCGMAGTYGHEKEHAALSAQIYAQSWQAQVQAHAPYILATGYSCRSQVKRLAQEQLRHPIEVLAQYVEQLKSDDKLWVQYQLAS